MQLWDETDSQKTKYNAQQAINAWDELAAGLYDSRKKPTEKKLEKVRATALQICALMAASEYKKETISKIKNLTLRAE